MGKGENLADHVVCNIYGGVNTGSSNRYIFYAVLTAFSTLLTCTAAYGDRVRELEGDIIFSLFFFCLINSDGNNNKEEQNQKKDMFIRMEA